MTNRYLTSQTLLIFKKFGPFYLSTTMLLNKIVTPTVTLMTLGVSLLLLLLTLVFCLALIQSIVYSMTYYRKVARFVLGSVLFIPSFFIILSSVLSTIPALEYLQLKDGLTVELLATLLLRYFNALIMAGLIFYHAMSKFRLEQLLKTEREKYELEIKSRDLLIESEREARKLEIGFLSAQMNPHFLHNSLNTMVGATIDSEPELAIQLTNLSHLMRYKLKCTKAESTIVDEVSEIEALKGYLEIVKWQYPHADMRFTTEGKELGQRIVPAILLDLVENMITHGMFRKGKYPIIIRRRLREDQVAYYLKNKIDPQSERKERNGIGLMNCRRRLELIVPGKHLLKTWKDTESYFNVELIIYQ